MLQVGAVLVAVPRQRGEGLRPDLAGVVGETDDVQLVLPPRSRFGQSRFNFQLLRQYSTRLGKRVAIATPDPVVQRLAEESGFGAVRLPGPPEPPGSPAAPPRNGAGSAPGPWSGASPPRRVPGLATMAPAGIAGAAPPPPSQGRLGGLGRLASRSGQVGARIRIGARLPGSG